MAASGLRNHDDLFLIVVEGGGVVETQWLHLIHICILHGSRMVMEVRNGDDGEEQQDPSHR